MVYMQHNRAHSGWQFIDEDFGGVFVSEPVLLSGPAKSGKTSAALRWAMEGVNRAEPTLFFTSDAARAVYETALRLRLPVKPAIDPEKLVLLEFNGSDPSLSPDDLAAQRFAQLQKIIVEKKIKRLVVDSVIPWILSESPKVVAHVIADMMSQIQKAEVTALYTLPRPASDAAVSLLYILQDQVPVALNIVPQSDPTLPIIEVARFAGNDNLPALYPVRIQADKLMVAADKGQLPSNAGKPPDAGSGKSGMNFSDELL
jgi:KaiC/GvpD/RAD55 family RecA-like ATPase